MKIFSRFPVFRMVIPFSIGILSAIYGDISIQLSLLLMIVGLSLSFIFTIRGYATGKYAQRWLAGIPFYCCFFGLGCSITWFHESIHFNRHFTEIPGAKKFLISLSDEPHFTGKGIRFMAKVEASRGINSWQSASG